MTPRVKRRTPRTDANGNVLDDFRGAYGDLAAAQRAGIPGDMLDVAGWGGDENDLTGFFAEQIYRVGEIRFAAPDAIEQLGDAIDVMQRICKSLGVDPKAAIPYGMARFKRQLHEGRHKRDRPGFSPEDAAECDAVMDEWGCPSGPGHDSHGHGKTPDGWHCLAD